MVRLVVLEQGHVERVEGVETSRGATISPLATARLSAITALGRTGVQLVVQGNDVGPVGCRGGGGIGVDGSDGRLDLERAGLVTAQAGSDEAVASLMRMVVWLRG
jgi:hypothetical protein